MDFVLCENKTLNLFHTHTQKYDFDWPSTLVATAFQQTSCKDS